MKTTEVILILCVFVSLFLMYSSIERIKKYIFIKNGAMYSILFLGGIMLVDAFGHEIPSWVSPVTTFAVVGFFYWKSLRHNKLYVA